VGLDSRSGLARSVGHEPDSMATRGTPWTQDVKKTRSRI
jgi:hypothetical protein